MKKQIDNFNKFSSEVSSKSPFISSTIIATNPFENNTQENAFTWIKPTTKQYYELPIGAITVQPINHESLSDRGLDLYQQCLDRVKQNNFKDEIAEYYVEAQPSGSWFADEESPHYDPNGIRGMMNTFQNYNVIGMTTSGGPIQTSTCVFIKTDPDDGVGTGWCLTRSGSLYKLHTQKDMVYIQNAYETYRNTHPDN
jgi:hypothetical protein